MEKHIEKEYKMLVNKSDFEKLLSFYDIKFKKQTNYYYDNINDDLRKQNIALRIREKNGFLFTLKKHGKDGLEEYECQVDKNSSIVFNQSPIKEMLNSFNLKGPFKCIGQLTTKRAMYITEDYELCFDINEYNNKLDYEIEYEYKKDHDGLNNFKKILAQADLVYQDNSKPKILRAIAK